MVLCSILFFLQVSDGTLIASRARHCGWRCKPGTSHKRRHLSSTSPLYFPLAPEQLNIALLQAWPVHQIVDADVDFKAFFTGCALAGPENCALMSAGQTPLEVNDNIQAILKAGRDVWYANASAPLTSGALRCEHTFATHLAPCLPFSFVVLLRGEMYPPTDWLTVSNSTIPEIAADFAAEAQASSAQVNKRDASDTTSYSVTALICSDGIEVNTTMEEVFEGIISSSRNVSHMCTSRNLFGIR